MNNINIRSNENKCNLNISNNAIEYNNLLAKEWATKLDSKVEEIDFSAKQYALNARSAANEAMETKNSILNNADFIAISNDLNGDNTIGTCVENMNFIQNASTYAQNANTSAENANTYAQNALNSAQNAETYSQEASAQAEIATQKVNSISSSLANYADINLSNISSSGVSKIKSSVNYDSTQAQLKLPHITKTYVNGASGYRLYSDGWCEQWTVSNGAQFITFLKPFKNTNYTVSATQIANGSTDSAYWNAFTFNTKTTTSIYMTRGQNEAPQISITFAGYATT